MNPCIPVPRRHLHRCPVITTLLCLACSLAHIFAAGGVVDQSIDALYNLRDQLQETVMKSVKGVGDAMQEGPPADPGGKPWTLQDLQQIQQKNQNLYNLNKELATNQQKLLNLDNQLLQKLPPDDPRRGALTSEMKQVAAGLADSRAQAKNFQNKTADANTAIDKWKARNDPNYVTPVRPPKPKPQSQDTGQSGGAEPPGPSRPDEPVGPSGPSGPTGPASTGPTWTAPTGPVGGGGGGGGNIDAWKTKEAQLEAEARALGKEREQAVIDYLNDPTPENKAEAAALKGKLDGLVNKLNKVRGKVDGLTGGSRPPLKVRTAQQIKNKWKQGGMAGGGEDHHHGPGGTDMPGSTSGAESHHHNSDGTDAPYNTVSGTGGAGKTANGGMRKRGTGKRRKGSVASTGTGGHTHGPGGMDTPNNQGRGQKRNPQVGNRRNAVASQNQSATRNLGGQPSQVQQSQVQNPNRQNRQRKRRQSQPGW